MTENLKTLTKMNLYKRRDELEKNLDTVNEEIRLRSFSDMMDRIKKKVKND